MKKVAIMQPYFLPYIGYFQLMNAVDEFVIYDNIEYTKKGWFNRNRILVNGQPDYISLPLKKDADTLDVKDRKLAETWPSDRKKMLSRISGSYRKAPQYQGVYPVIEEIIMFEESNLFLFILHSLEKLKTWLGIGTPLIISSEIPVNHGLKGIEKVISIARARQATNYVNPIGGLALYSKDEFAKEGITLEFLQAKECSYPQFDNEFVPWLSVIDVMMFNSREAIGKILEEEYTLV